MNKKLNIPISKPYFGVTEEKEVARVIRSGWVMQGSKVAQFEKLVADYTGVKYGVATTSATTALFLALQVLGIGSGDEVIVPSFSFIASANVIVHAGAKVIFADIDPETYNIDPADIEAKITPKTKAIITVDQIGLPCDIEKIRKIAKKHNIYVLDDAACALGSEISGKKVGGFADITCFSFHPRKIISTGEGGMIVTNNEVWEKSARSLRNHGIVIDKDGEKFPVVGYNFRMTDLQAVLGVVQMHKLDKIIAKRIYLAGRYNQAFSNIKEISVPFIPKGFKHNFQSYLIRINGIQKKQRDGVVERLAKKGISTRKGIPASHLEGAYVTRIGKINLPNTVKASQQTLMLPIYYSLTNKEQDFIIKEVINEVRSI